MIIKDVEELKCYNEPNFQIAPQNCVWSSWQPWSSCSKSCGQGNKERIRNKATVAIDGGIDCVGPEKETFLCKIRDCQSNLIHTLF